jgi:glycosyltransferase involved in cell wall biosynthesis
VKPRVLVVVDVPTWAWQRKAAAYQQHLSGQFDLTVAYHQAAPGLKAADATDFTQVDLVHFFEVTQTAFLDRYPAPRPFKAVAGLTAHVWQAWGPTVAEAEERMHAWAKRVDALHGNSLLLFHELTQFHPHVYYTPNGVDPTFFRRREHLPSPREVVFGHVGKPNPRKGAALIIEAARSIDAPLKLIQRTSKLAYGAAEMANFYQTVSVMVTASNMDGTPNPMLEGAATECALLSTPIGNMPELIKDGYNGFLTKETLPRVPGPSAHPLPLSPEQAAAVAKGQDRLRHELAERMLWFRTHVPETIAMGQAARRSIEADWTWERQVGHVARMWTEVLGL